MGTPSAQAPTEGTPTGLRRCFVVSPIGKPPSQTRRRADNILDHIIRPALADLGFHAQRADDEPKPGIVTEAIIDHILDAELVVADLSGHNPNVFYELGVAHAVARPVVLMIEEGESIPFDVAAIGVVSFVPDYAGREAAIGALRTAAGKVLDSPRAGNPVTRTVDRATLERGAPDRDRFILEELRQLREQTFAARFVPQRGAAEADPDYAVAVADMLARHVESALATHPDLVATGARLTAISAPKGSPPSILVVLTMPNGVNAELMTHPVPVTPWGLDKMLRDRVTEFIGERIHLFLGSRGYLP